jgi:hypothetical protein
MTPRSIKTPLVINKITISLKFLIISFFSF